MDGFLKGVVDDALAPFAEAFAKNLAGKTEQEAEEAGEELVEKVKGLLLGTKTTADDTLILAGLKGLGKGIISGVDKPYTPAE